jgi:hypothetical protein
VNGCKSRQSEESETSIVESRNNRNHGHLGCHESQWIALLVSSMSEALRDMTPGSAGHTKKSRYSHVPKKVGIHPHFNSPYLSLSLYNKHLCRSEKPEMMELPCKKCAEGKKKGM